MTFSTPSPNLHTSEIKRKKRELHGTPGYLVNHLWFLQSQKLNEPTAKFTYFIRRVAHRPWAQISFCTDEKGVSSLKKERSFARCPIDNRIILSQYFCTNIIMFKKRGFLFLLIFLNRKFATKMWDSSWAHTLVHYWQTAQYFDSCHCEHDIHSPLQFPPRTPV